jgi:hypothetical protein
LSNSIRLAAQLQDWDGTPVSAEISLLSCSNEPNDNVSFKLKAAAISSGGDMNSPSFGQSQTINITNIPAAYALNQNSFPLLSVGNAYPTENSAISNTFVLFDLSRNVDQFTNQVIIAGINVSYSRFIIPSQ